MNCQERDLELAKEETFVVIVLIRVDVIVYSELSSLDKPLFWFLMQ